MPRFLSSRISELDLKKPSGISIITAGFPSPFTFGLDKEDQKMAAQQCLPGKNYKAKNILVNQLLIELSNLYSIEFHIADVGVVVTPIGKPPFPNLKADAGKDFYTYRRKKIEHVGHDRTPTSP